MDHSQVSGFTWTASATLPAPPLAAAAALPPFAPLPAPERQVCFSNFSTQRERNSGSICLASVREDADRARPGARGWLPLTHSQMQMKPVQRRLTSCALLQTAELLQTWDRGGEPLQGWEARRGVSAESAGAFGSKLAGDPRDRCRAVTRVSLRSPKTFETRNSRTTG